MIFFLVSFCFSFLSFFFPFLVSFSAFLYLFTILYSSFVSFSFFFSCCFLFFCFFRFLSPAFLIFFNTLPLCFDIKLEILFCSPSFSSLLFPFLVFFNRSIVPSCRIVRIGFYDMFRYQIGDLSWSLNQIYAVLRANQVNLPVRKETRQRKERKKER